jgi:beta-glucanase (GH16 family)
MVWDDEFSGTTLDASKWSPRYWTGGNGFYSPSNVSVGGGVLHLRAPTRSSSAMAQTLGKLALRSGRVEISGKMPPGQGLWPALWLRPDDPGNYFPEFDILEMWSTDIPGDEFDGQVPWFTYHWANATKWETNQSHYRAPFDLTASYHQFALDWSPGHVRWYVDGVQRWALDGPMVVDTTPMSLVLSLQIGGAWWTLAGEPNATTPFPAEMSIDYVRVYQPA